MGTKCNYQYPYKKEAMGDLTQKKRGHVTRDRDCMMWLQIKEPDSHGKLEEARNVFSLRTCQHLDCSLLKSVLASGTVRE